MNNSLEGTISSISLEEELAAIFAILYVQFIYVLFMHSLVSFGIFPIAINVPFRSFLIIFNRYRKKAENTKKMNIMIKLNTTEYGKKVIDEQ